MGVSKIMCEKEFFTVLGVYKCYTPKNQKSVVYQVMMQGVQSARKISVYVEIEEDEYGNYSDSSFHDIIEIEPYVKIRGYTMGLAESEALKAAGCFENYGGITLEMGINNKMIEYAEVKSVSFFPANDTDPSSVVVTEINVKLAHTDDIITLSIPIAIKKDTFGNFSIESELIVEPFIHYVYKNSDYFDNLSKRQARGVYGRITKIAKDVTIATAQLKPY